MRILIVQPHMFPGGAEKAIVYLSHHLRRMGNHVSVATLSVEVQGLPSIAREMDYIIPKEQIYPKKGLFSDSSEVLRTFFIEMRKLHEIVSENAKSYDVINPHVFPSYWATAGMNPVIWTCNEVLGPYDKARMLYSSSLLFRSLFKLVKELDFLIVSHFVHQILTNSPYNDNLIERRYGRKPMLALPGVDLEFFQQEVPDAKERIGLEGKFVLLQVGALLERKRHDIGIKVLRKLKSDIPDVFLLIVGRGPLKNELKKEAGRLGVSSDVKILSNLTEEELRLIYKASDVLLFPVIDQTFGLVPFEALASGTPVIVSKNAGCAKIIEQNSLGLVVKPKMEEFYDAVLSIIRGKNNFEDMLLTARNYIKKHLTWEKFAEVHKIAFKMICELE